MTAYQYLRIRRSELGSHGRRLWIFRLWRFTCVIVREAK